MEDPVQTETDVPPPFEVERKGVLYLVTPVLGYDIRGLVVSEHDSRAFTDLAHERWKDNLNVKDVCLVWGRNVTSGVIKKMKFRNRDFTCYYSYPDAATGDLFTESGLSNNHLLAGDDNMARKVRSVRRGDQIRVRGWLASYERPGTPFRRGTSTTREDRGNGACETVYVTEFEVLRSGNPGWRHLGFGCGAALGPRLCSCSRKAQRNQGACADPARSGDLRPESPDGPPGRWLERRPGERTARPTRISAAPADGGSFIGNVKFHIDRVKGLGTFVEIEAQDAGGRYGTRELRAQCGAYAVNSRNRGRRPDLRLVCRNGRLVADREEGWKGGRGPFPAFVPPLGTRSSPRVSNGVRRRRRSRRCGAYRCGAGLR